MKTDERHRQRGWKGRKVKWVERIEAREGCGPKQENVDGEDEVKMNSDTE